MATIFDTEKWSATQAVLYIFCDVRMEPEDVAMRQLKVALAAWLADPLKYTFPINNPIGLKRLTAFVKEAKLTWPNGFAKLQLHPMVWTWFVASKCWRSTPKRFWQDFHAWSADHVTQGQILLVQRRASPDKGWTAPIFTLGETDTRLGVRPTTLIFRAFQPIKASSEWRTVKQRLEDPTSEPVVLSRPSGHTSRSRGCEEAIRALLPAVCKLTRNVRRAKGDDDGYPPYEAPKLYQADLFELLSRVEGWSVVENYGISTRSKSLSKVVKCRRGKPPGSTAARTIRGLTAASVQKHP